MFQPPFLAMLKAIGLPLFMIIHPFGLANGADHYSSARFKELDHQSQEKSTFADKSTVPETAAKTMDAASGTAIVLAKNGGDKDLVVRGAALVVRSDGIVVAKYQTVFDKEAGKVYDDLYLKLRREKDAPGSASQYRLEVILLNQELDLVFLRVIERGDRKTTEGKLNLPSIESLLGPPSTVAQNPSGTSDPVPTPGSTGNSDKGGVEAQDNHALQDKSLSPEDRRKIGSVKPCVGLVQAKFDDGKGLFPRGSAVVVRSDGIVVTNYHVVYDKGASEFFKDLYLQMGNDGNQASPVQYRLELALIDRPHDLVLLRLISATTGLTPEPKLSLPAMELGDEKKLELLEDLVVIGFPEKGGPTHTVNRGVIEGIDLKEGWIKTDARLLPGNSGGAIVNLQGKLIGVPTKVETSGDLGAIGYARSVNLVAQMLEKLRENESLRGDEKTKVVSEREKTKAQNEVKRTTLPPSPQAVTVQGMVKDVRSGNPIAGARVGLLLPGRKGEDAAVIGWGGTDADGQFKFEKPVLPGKYALQARVIGGLGYAPYSGEVEIKPGAPPLVIELKLAREQ